MPSLAETCLAAGRSHDNAASGRKLTELDAVRGIAAVVVFNLHFLGGVRGDVLARLSATPLYAAANGGAAVLLFFVLSGFVLTLAPLRAGRLRRLAGPAIRRYPRLAGPVVLTALLSVGLARYGGFPGVGWIGTRTGKLFPLDLFWGSQMNNGAIWPVLREAAFGTFFTGTSDHNPVLWTMKWELLGSVLAFALALVLLLPLPRAVRMAGAGLLAGAAAWHSIWLIAFPIGVAGALAHLRHGHAMRIPPLAAAVLFCAAAYVMSWNIEHAAGAWRWADSISGPAPELFMGVRAMRVRRLHAGHRAVLPARATRAADAPVQCAGAPILPPIPHAFLRAAVGGHMDVPGRFPKRRRARLAAGLLRRPAGRILRPGLPDRRLRPALDQAPVQV